MDRKPVVMVAEHEADQRWLFQRWLTDAGYYVRTVEDGAWALSLIPPDPPDLVIIDLHLSEVDGFEVCRQLKTNVELESIPILVTSTRTDPVIQAQIQLIGIESFLAKPFSRMELTHRVEQLLVPKFNPHFEALRLAADHS